MAVHLLRLPTEPADWAYSIAQGAFPDTKARIIPEWPEGTRFALIAVVRNPGPPGEAHTRALWVTTPEETDSLLSNHAYRILWFTVARYHITDDMIEKTLTGQERWK
jgi:hypothetical protein